MIVSCSEKDVYNDIVDAQEIMGKAPVTDQYSVLLKKARWGDAEAYVKLANCYRDGKGVKQDFINMLAMVSLADEYSSLSRMEDYFAALPEDSEYKLVFDAMEMFHKNKPEESLAMVEKMIEKDYVEGYTAKGLILYEQGNREEGKRL